LPSQCTVDLAKFSIHSENKHCRTINRAKYKHRSNTRDGSTLPSSMTAPSSSGWHAVQLPHHLLVSASLSSCNFYHVQSTALVYTWQTMMIAEIDSTQSLATPRQQLDSNWLTDSVRTCQYPSWAIASRQQPAIVLLKPSNGGGGGNSRLPTLHLPRYTMLAQYMLLPCVRPSVTRRYYTKMAKPRIMQTMPYDSPGTPISFLLPKISAKFQWGHPQRGRQTEVG